MSVSQSSSSIAARPSPHAWPGIPCPFVHEPSYHDLQHVAGRLRTDAVDLYWYHRPDGQTPVSETLEALHELIQAGKIRAIGASNFSAAQLEKADAVARERGLTRFSAIQNDRSLALPDDTGSRGGCRRQVYNRLERRWIGRSTDDKSLM